MNRKPKAILEGILFAMGEAVPVKRIAEVMELDEKEVEILLEELSADYASSAERGIHLIRLEDSYQLCTKREYYDYIHQLKEKARRSALTNAGLEVLSVVAYNQPVTRSSIEFIRGVNSDGPLNNLVAAGLVREVGRLDAPGRPILFGTTDEFLRSFNLSSLTELPDVDKEYSFEGLNAELSGAPILISEDELNKDQIKIDFEIEDPDIDHDVEPQQQTQMLLDEE
jgi:segregation and condensation protein B